MSEEVSTVTEIKTTSDGNVKLPLSEYNELVSTIADQKSSIQRLRDQPPIINRTQVIKTDEMLNKEMRAWGGGLMGFGTGLFALGAALFRSGRGG